MKQASVLLFLFAFLLLSTTAAQAQLMRKDTANLPRSKWEVGLDLKPIWDRSEPYNFVVRYFFKDRWALRGGMGLEMNWSKDTLDIEERQITGSSLRYELFEFQEREYLNLQAFLGIQYEQKAEKLRWYGATDFFYFKYLDDYTVPTGAYGTPDPQIGPVQDFARIILRWDRQEGFGVKMISGLRYQFLPKLSISSEIALISQVHKYSVQTSNRYGGERGNDYFKSVFERGHQYAIDLEPLFRVFINYHFFKN